ncbi:hypothetical protein NLJ89_g12001 [Agrocybe chaxingu]|uniref:Protein kinase domain-containing protein n=1 Tax=Agrocybe chaxingu TaxID=84603 RepID=A0A9W8JN58_9AGAR|nr:hypothetical protein NLJ89_g12001 [Agrocybe chaxingu]
MSSFSLLPINAIEAVTLKGLAQKDGVSVDLTLKRSPLPELKVQKGINGRPDGAAALPPSRFPPSGALHITLASQERLGYGSLSSVYRKAQRTVIPLPKKPLSTQPWSLYKALWFLGAMGYSLASSRMGIKFELDIPATSSGEEDGCEALAKDESPQRISILLLERLGDALCRENFVIGTKKDLWAMNNDLAKLGIAHEDMRSENVLKVPESSLAWSLPSTHRKRIYGWRIIDWEFARRSDDVETKITARGKIGLHNIFVEEIQEYAVEDNPQDGEY